MSEDLRWPLTSIRKPHTFRNVMQRFAADIMSTSFQCLTSSDLLVTFDLHQTNLVLSKKKKIFHLNALKWLVSQPWFLPLIYPESNVYKHFTSEWLHQKQYVPSTWYDGSYTQFFMTHSWRYWVKKVSVFNIWWPHISSKTISILSLDIGHLFIKKENSRPHTLVHTHTCNYAHAIMAT